MRKIVVVAASLGLAGCSSFSMPDMFKSAPPVTAVQFESQPPGADARTSSGETCKTPCSLQLPVSESFSVTFTLPKYQPETVQVQVTKDSNFAGGVVIDPNPVYAELQPAPPPPRGRKAAPRVRKPRPAPAPAAAPAPSGDAGTTPFPPPPSR